MEDQVDIAQSLSSDIILITIAREKARQIVERKENAGGEDMVDGDGYSLAMTREKMFCVLQRVGELVAGADDRDGTAYVRKIRSLYSTGP